MTPVVKDKSKSKSARRHVSTEFSARVDDLVTCQTLDDVATEQAVAMVKRRLLGSVNLARLIKAASSGDKSWMPVRTALFPMFRGDLRRCEACIRVMKERGWITRIKREKNQQSGRQTVATVNAIVFNERLRAQSGTHRNPRWAEVLAYLNLIKQRLDLITYRQIAA